jgi:hypothetical protein
MNTHFYLLIRVVLICTFLVEDTWILSDQVEPMRLDLQLSLLLSLYVSSQIGLVDNWQVRVTIDGTCMLTNYTVVLLIYLF